LVQGSGSKAFDAIASAAVAGAVTVAEQVAAAEEARRAEVQLATYDPCGLSECFEDPETSLDEAREYALAYVNRLRSDRRIEALRLDYGLSAFAQRGSRQLAHDHWAHKHLMDDPGACPACGENQSDPNGATPGPVREQLDQVLAGMMDEGPGGPSRANIVDPAWRRLGVGIVNSGGPMYLTMDFSP
jgi:uncharacterized protein YkwD